MTVLTHAMLLAAGLGTRMRPLTADTPKPLLTLAGQTLMDHALDRIAEAGIGEVVVNAHWFPEQVAAVLARREAPHTTLLREETLLETGGGVRNALPHLGAGPFLVVNGDAFWLDGPRSTIEHLASRFDAETMDAMLLVIRTALVPGEVGRGDFMLDPMGRPRRPKEREMVPYVYGGLQIVHPRLFEGAPEGAFSMNLLWDKAMEQGRLCAVVHDGAWFHLSTPRDLVVAEAAISTGVNRPLF